MKLLLQMSHLKTNLVNILPQKYHYVYRMELSHAEGGQIQFNIWHTKLQQKDKSSTLVKLQIWILSRAMTECQKFYHFSFLLGSNIYCNNILILLLEEGMKSI